MTEFKADYRYFGENNEFRAKLTGQVRFRLFKKLFKPEPLLVLQMEESLEKQHRNRLAPATVWAKQEKTRWRDAKLEDLSVMDIAKLSIVRDGGEMPVCFRPMRSQMEWKLVLQIMRGSVQDNQWVDAKMQDLLFKEGKILGGVGLVGR